MTKKEIGELKKLYQKDKGCITRICGCYVNAEQERVMEFKDAFLSLPEEDAFKYYEIFRRTLSGKLGKNLLDLSFPLEAETEDGKQAFLLKLRDSKLTDDELLDQFYEQVISAYDTEGSYLILLIHNVYDIPGKANDGFAMEDASEEVYSYLLCSICPVELSKPGLSYDPKQSVIKNRTRDWVVGVPESGFLFPAFTDRSTDIHSTLYYEKNPKKPQLTFIEEVLGIPSPVPMEVQQEIFQELVEKTFGDALDYETVVNIQESMDEQLMESGSNALDKNTLAQIFQENGGAGMDSFEETFDTAVPKGVELSGSNVMTTGKIEVKSQGITVQAKSEYGHLLETRKIDGRNCLVIALEGDIIVNGISL